MAKTPPTPILAVAYGGPIDGWKGVVVPNLEIYEPDVPNKVVAVYSRRSTPAVSPVQYAFERYEEFTTSI